MGQDLAHEGLTTSIEEIIRLNAAAVGLSVFVGSDYEHETLMNLADMVNACEDYGIPVMAVTAVGREWEKLLAKCGEPSEADWQAHLTASGCLLR